MNRNKMLLVGGILLACFLVSIGGSAATEIGIGEQDNLQLDFSVHAEKGLKSNRMVGLGCLGKENRLAHAVKTQGKFFRIERTRDQFLSEEEDSGGELPIKDFVLNQRLESEYLGRLLYTHLYSISGKVLLDTLKALQESKPACADFFLDFWEENDYGSFGILLPLPLAADFQQRTQLLYVMEAPKDEVVSVFGSALVESKKK